MTNRELIIKTAIIVIFCSLLICVTGISSAIERNEIKKCMCNDDLHNEMMYEETNTQQLNTSYKALATEFAKVICGESTNNIELNSYIKSLSKEQCCLLGLGQDQYNIQDIQVDIENLKFTTTIKCETSNHNHKWEMDCVGGNRNNKVIKVIKYQYMGW